jgi:hypothetical protein
MLEALVETAKNIEEDDPVILEFAVVLTNGEVTMYKIVECKIKVKSTCFMINKELVLEPEPQVPRGAAAFLNDLHKIMADRVGEPGERHHPSWSSLGCWGRRRQT